jgi:hypothetical protein
MLTNIRWYLLFFFLVVIFVIIIIKKSFLLWHLANNLLWLFRRNNWNLFHIDKFLLWFKDFRWCTYLLFSWVVSSHFLLKSNDFILFFNYFDVTPYFASKSLIVLVNKSIERIVVARLHWSLKFDHNVNKVTRFNFLLKISLILTKFITIHVHKPCLFGPCFSSFVPKCPNLLELFPNFNCKIVLDTFFHKLGSESISSFSSLDSSHSILIDVIRWVHHWWLHKWLVIAQDLLIFYLSSICTLVIRLLHELSL